MVSQKIAKNTKNQKIPGEPGEWYEKDLVPLSIPAPRND
jgi:hypothetical protein